MAQIVIGDAVWTIGGDMSALQKALGEAEGHVKASADKAGKSLEGISKSAKKVGTQMSVAGGVMAAGIGLAVKASSDFHSALAEVATLGVKDLDAVGEAAKAASGVLGGDVVDAVKAAYQAVSAGIPEENLASFLDSSARAAAAGVTDLTTAVEFGTNMVNVFGGDVETAFDQAFVAVKLGVTTFEELASTTGQLAPIWNSAGLASDEMLASIAALTKQGIATAQSVTGLRGAMSNVIKPTSEAQKIAEELGLEFDTASLKSKGWGEFLSDLVSKISASGSAMDAANPQIQAMAAELAEAAGGSAELAAQFDQARGANDALSGASDNLLVILAQLFGSVEGLNTVLALTSETGMKEYTGALGEMQGATGQMGEAFRTLEETSSNLQFGRLTNSIAQLRMEIGDLFLPILMDLLPTVKDWISGLKDLIDAHPWLATEVAKLSLGMTAFLVTFGPILIAVSSAINAFLALGKGFAWIGGLLGFGKAAAAAGAAGAGAAGAVGAGGGLIGAFGALIATIGSIPIATGIAGAALIALGAVLVKEIGVSIADTIKAWLEYFDTKTEVIQLEDQYEAQLKRQGVVLTEVEKLARGSNERRAAVSAATTAARMQDIATEIEGLLGREATADELHRAELARVTADLNLRESAAVAKSQMTATEIKAIMERSATEKTAFREYLEALDATAMTTEEITARIREFLKDLSPSTRHSPSINDMVAEGLGETVSLYEQAVNRIAGVMQRLQDVLLRTWEYVGELAMRVVESIDNAISAVLRKVNVLLGGGATLLGGLGIPGFADGGLVGGLGRRVAILAGEEGPEFATLPGGRRVLLGTHGPGLYAVPPGTYIHEFRETLRMLSRGIPYAGAYASGGTVPAVTAGGVTINVSIPSVTVREEADVRRISEEIAARVSRSVTRARR